MIKIYDKLVRDKIPAIIEEQGKTVHITKAEGISLTHYFDTKLKEELNEYYENGEVEELADLVEVIYALLFHKGVSLEEFENIREQKNQERGSFKEGIILKSVEN